MIDFLTRLPSILILAVLVGVFVSLRRHVRSARLNFWTVAWLLIFIHFSIEIFQSLPGTLGRIVDTIDIGSLQVSALLFIASLTSFVEDKRRTWTLIAVTAVPVLIFSAAASFAIDGSQFRPLNTLCMATLFFGPAALVFIMRRRIPPSSLIWIPILAGAGLWSIRRIWLNDIDTAFNVILTLGFGVPGLLFWKRYRRWTPGVITNVGGFVLWGLVFPVGLLTDKYFPNLHVPELWNVPKFFVAFGMILVLLEDKSEVLAVTSRREHKLNEQLQKFASITSRLLTGVEVNSLCGEIAHAITETSNFQRAVILLGADDKGMYLAGHSGLDNDALALLKKFEPRWRIDDVSEVCRTAARIGANSYLMQPEQVARYSPLAGAGNVEDGPNWRKGCRVVVPLQSTHGAYVGCITLDAPYDVTKITSEEMSKIELLSGDLAVTIGNTTLHRQLVRSEKLAAIGQLVAGVAHELNNPLASIVGYAELMTDDTLPSPARQKLEKLSREAHRMKRIIENLLRFARQNNLEKKSANIESLLQEVISLREYHIRNHDVDVKLEIAPGLPQVALDEDQFKQILLNLLNNSIDALESAREKSIRIGAVRQGDRVFVRFEDTGPGFADVNRAFDPFYTTKPVGKGTGLGLSICYGIVKEHGGDIYAANLTPGARVVLELPISEALAEATATL